jgi:hypothetical protein
VSSLRRRILGAGALTAVAASVLLATATNAHAADPAADAAAALAVQHIYVSPQARAAGVPADAGAAAGLPDTVRIAVLADGNAGQIAADISTRLGAGDSHRLTVGVVIVADTAVTAFNAVSTVGYCKGGADLAARDALDALDQSGGTPAVDDLLRRYTRELSTLPPDRGESSCASALGPRPTHDARAWLWWLVGVVVGLALIGALAVYSSRVVAARRAAGEAEEPTTDELPDWIACAEGEDGEDGSQTDQEGKDWDDGVNTPGRGGGTEGDGGDGRG